MSGKYGDLIQKARNTENQKTGKPESQFSGSGSDTKPGSPSPPAGPADVNLTIKVPRAWRQHWVSQAKGEGNTLTAVIIEALSQKYGLPENQKTRKP